MLTDAVVPLIYFNKEQPNDLLSRIIHTDAAVKTFIIRLQGLFGMSKSSLHVFPLHISHLDVRTDAAVDTLMIRTAAAVDTLTGLFPGTTLDVEY